MPKFKGGLASGFDFLYVPKPPGTSNLLRLLVDPVLPALANKTLPVSRIHKRKLKYHFVSLGWVVIPIKDIREKPIRTFMIQIAVISNHQNGRDTHMRQIKIHSPVEGRHNPLEMHGNFTTVDFQKFATIR